MRLDIWLAQPKTGTALLAARHVALCVCGAWMVIGGYGLWITSRSLDDARSALDARRKQVGDMAVTLRNKKNAAEEADTIRTTAPDGRGTAEFADEMERLATESSVELIGTRFGAPEPNAGARPAAHAGQATNAQNQSAQPTQPGSTSAQAGSDASADGGWKKVTFECTVIGPYRALTGFLDRTNALKRVFEITGVQVTRSSADVKTGQVKLQLKLSGDLYGLSDKP